MARHTFGGDSASFVVNVAVNKAVSAANGVVVTFSTAATGGSAVTDLLAADGTTPVTSVTTNSDGTLPLFYGPSGTTQVWAIVPAAAERLLLSHNDLAATYAPITGSAAYLPVIVMIGAGIDPTGVADSSAAINAKLATVPATGARVYFPPGTYAVANLTCANPVAVEGAHLPGSPNLNTPYWQDGATTLVVSSSTAKGLTLAGTSSSVRGITLKCTAAPAASGSVGLYIPSGGGNGNRYEDVTVRGFYNNVQIDDGTEWYMHQCFIYDFVNYGIKVANATNGDGGDMGITNCEIVGGPVNVNAAAGLRYESGGGMRLFGNKFNHRGAAANYPDHSIDVAIADGVNSGLLLITGNSIEGARVANIRVRLAGTTGLWSGISICGNEIGPFNAAGRAIQVDPGTNNKITDLTIVGNLMRNVTASVYTISLSNVSRIAVAGNIYTGPQTGSRLTADANVRSLQVAPGDNAGVGPTTDQPANNLCAPGGAYYDTTLGSLQIAEPNIRGIWLTPLWSRGVNDLRPTATTETPLSVKSLASQTADLFSFYNDAIGTLAAINGGGVYVARTAAGGIVLKDTNGHYWRLTVGITGTLTTADLGTGVPTT